MDIKVKPEPIDSERVIKEELELTETGVEGEIKPIVECNIKKEKELIIESDWKAAKFEDEEIEYYQEFVEECNQNMLDEEVVENGRGYEQYVIEYVDESDDSDGDYEYDNYTESDERESGEKNDIVGVDFAESVERECSSESKSLYQPQLHKWVVHNYINIVCPVCNKILPNYCELRKHVTLNHKESIEQSESNYNFSSDNCGVCKNCNQEFATQYSRYVHSKKHNELDSKLCIYKCKICNFSSKRRFVQSHILMKHPEVMKEFKPSNCIKKMKCPLCPITYTKRPNICFHFMDKHPIEYKEKCKYTCPLCADDHFGAEEHFLQHLIEQHNLNSWKVLNYRKLFEDKEYFKCAKCSRLFFQNDIFKLLSHFIKHEKKFFWSCKFCYKKYSFNLSSFGHMCVRMMRYYETRNETAEVSKKTEYKIKNLQEFEEHIAHVCPFCNKEFKKMIKWQHHMRTDHEIDTLKGLQMEVIDNDSNKLRCVICKIAVTNIPEQVHAHCFQHSPYKPYKCFICLKMLNSFKMATDHILKRCIDDDSSYDIRCVLKMQCSICNFEKFNDLNGILTHYENKHNYLEDFFIKETDNSTMTCMICTKKCDQNEKKTCFLHLQHHFDEKTFKCTLCLRSYPTYKTISEHLLEFHNAKPSNYESNEREAGKTSYSEDSNVRKSANVEELSRFVSYVCSECNECMTTKTNWDIHISTHHKSFAESNLYIKAADGTLKCPTCSITLCSNKFQQRKHKLTHMPQRSFMCNLCHFRSISLDGIYKHCRRSHFAQRTFKCPICPDILQTEYQRTEHLKTTHPRDKWPESVCLICYKVLASKYCLNRHMDTHKEDCFRHTCEVCGTKIFELRDFHLHMNRHKLRGENKVKLSGEIIDDFSSQSSSPNGPSNDSTNPIEILNESDTEHEFEGFVICETKEEMIDDIASQSLSANDTSVIQHINKRKSTNVRYAFDEFISYACPECNDVMTSQKDWDSHIRTQHKFFDESNLYIKEVDGSLKCPTCRITLANSVYRQQEHKAVHMPYKTFICNICSQRCSSLSGIYSHLRRKHFAKGTFDCPICNDVSQTLFQRAEHMKNIHPRKEWPELMCSTCYKMFPSKRCLQRHMSTHSADRVNYTCDVCGTRISDEANFKVHMDEHKIRGETNIKLGDTIATQSTLEHHTKSNDIGIDIVPESENLHKRKYITKFSEIKKKKMSS